MQYLPIDSIGYKNEIYKKEKDFYNVWKIFCDQKISLKDGSLKGIESGQLNEFEGPDFQGSEFELDGRIYRGDVEIHKECADWVRHGHHLDQRYDRVVLHLVASTKIFSVLNSKNQNIPSISLLEFPESLDANKCQQSCDFINKPIDISIFQDLALQRMFNKSQDIFNLISTHGIDQTLYIQILKSLGNVKNKNNYERLATLVPWKLVHIFKGKNKHPEFWKALYLGAAGLIKNDSNYDLNKHWENCIPLIEGLPLIKENWRRGGIRPNNFPQKRLTGLALFVWQMCDSSIYNIFQRIFCQRFSKDILLNKIISTFNTSDNQNLGKKYWGRNLMLEITGNVLIPFFYKMATINQSFGFKEYLEQLYLELPVTQNYGRLKSLKIQSKTNQSIRNYFYFNQALIHLQNNYCSSYYINNCPLQTIKQKN